MKTIKLKPAEGFKVRKPDGDFLKDAGEELPASVYWRRRIQFGEVVIVKLDNAQIPKVQERKAKKEEEKKEVKKPEAKKAEAKKKAPAKAKADTKKTKESK